MAYSASAQRLYSIRDLISELADIRFFINLDKSDVSYSDDELANVIQAKNYTKSKQKLAEFVVRQEERLATFRNRVKEAEREFKNAESSANSKRPGSSPGTFFLDRSDPEQVARHNQRVQEYNNRVDLHRRLVDQALRSKERYEDALEKFNEKKSEVEEQIREREEELKPAIDQDMVAFLGKLQQLVYDCFRNKELFFESFALIFMAKKAYIFFYDRIESASDRDLMSNIFRDINSELESLIKKNPDALRGGFTEIISYVYNCFHENELIFNSMKEQLSELPYELCDAELKKAGSLSSIPVDTSFQYSDIVDPNELAIVEVSVSKRRKELEEHIAEIDLFLTKLSSTFDTIAQTLSDSKEKLRAIGQNKIDRLGEAFEYSRFILGVFYEDIQDEYLKQQKSFLEAVQLEIEESLSLSLTQLLRGILDTDLLYLPAEQEINSNSAFSFLNYRQNIQGKKEAIQAGIRQVNEHLSNLSRQPQEKAHEFSGKLQTLLGISLIPIANLGVLFPLSQETTKFMPAFSSSHPVYIELREKTNSKLQIFVIVHAVIAALIGGGTFAVEANQKPFLASGSAVYIISAGTLFWKKKQISDL
jgi:hypothetical protein